MVVDGVESVVQDVHDQLGQQQEVVREAEQTHNIDHSGSTDNNNTTAMAMMTTTSSTDSNNNNGNSSSNITRRTNPMNERIDGEIHFDDNNNNNVRSLSFQIPSWSCSAIKTCWDCTTAVLQLWIEILTAVLTVPCSQTPLQRISISLLIIDRIIQNITDLLLQQYDNGNTIASNNHDQNSNYHCQYSSSSSSESAQDAVMIDTSDCTGTTAAIFASTTNQQ